MHKTLRFVYNNLMTSVFTPVFTLVLNPVMSHIPIHLLLIYIQVVQTLAKLFYEVSPPFFISIWISEIQSSLESLDCVLKG